MSEGNPPYLIKSKDRFFRMLPHIAPEQVEKMLHIERLRYKTKQNLYIVAGQIYSQNLHPIDSWTLFRWMQERGIPSRYIIRKDSLFYKTIKSNQQTQDVVAIETDGLHDELLDLTDLWVHAQAFIVEWRTDSIIDIWLQQLPGCRYVFLQHGIIGTYVNKVLLDVFKNEYNDINVSSEHERSLVALDEESQQKCFIAGLPRYDLLQQNTEKAESKGRKTVFVMLTWREYLNREERAFYDSVYIKSLLSLFSQENLCKMEKEGVHFVFALHHVIAHRTQQLNLFEGVETIQSQEEVAYWIRHAHALITDFSSITFDFLFQNKPVIFWIPDKKASQQYHYSIDAEKIDSALNFQKDFFNIANSIEEVMKMLTHYTQRGFSLEEEYQKKVSKFFAHKNNFSQRIFDNICTRLAAEPRQSRYFAAHKIGSSPKVSVIIPAYNAEKYLNTCLESLSVQTFGDFEAIVVNDGSTDYTRNICEQYVFKDMRVRVIHQKNSGVSVARNKGLEMARGEYITFIDADDWVTPDYLSIIVNTQPDCDLLFFGNIHHHKDGTMHAYSPGNRKAYEQVDREDLLLRMSQNDCWYEFFGYTWNKRFKNSIIKQHKIEFLPNLSLREDELFTECYTRHIQSVACTANCIYNYRFSYGGLTYRFHPGKEVLVMAKGLEQATEGIIHHRMLAFKKSKVFHYLFVATLNLHTKESLPVFEHLYTLYQTYHTILTSSDNPFLDRRTRKRYQRIFAHSKWFSRLWFLLKRKKMKKTYHGV